MDFYQTIALVIAVLGGVPGIILIIRTVYRKTFVRLYFDEKQSLVCQIDSDNERINNKYCFLFYSLSLIGHGDRPTTPKDVKFEVKKGKQWVKADKVNLRTHRVGGVESCAILSNGVDTVVIMNWHNFAPSNDPLIYGKPLTMSMAFCLDLGLDEIKECKYMRFFIEDYFGKKYKKKLKIKPRYFQAVEKNLKVLDRASLPSNLSQI